MARVGELLVALGWITRDQCLQALQAQVLWGARLGTNLVELGFVDLDRLSQALARHHALPAALAAHFDGADRALQERISPEVAERFACIPLFRAGAQVVVAASAPLDDRARTVLTRDLGCAPAAILTAIAAELRIRHHLERTYQIPPDTRVRVRGPTPPAPPRFEILPVDASRPEVAMPRRDPAAPPVDRPSRDPAVPPGPATSRAMTPRPGGLALGSASGRPSTSIPPTRFPVGVPSGTVPPRTTTPRDGISPSDGVRRLATSPHAGDGSSPSDGVRRIAPRPRAGTEPERRSSDASPQPRRVVREAIEAGAPGRPAAPGGPPALGRVPLKRITRSWEATPPLSLGTAPPPISPTLGEATRAIRRGANRDTVSQLVIQTVAQFVPATEAALILIVRGPAAIAHAGFSRVKAALPEVVVPLDQPGLVASVIATNAPARSPAAALDAIDYLVLSALGAADDDLVAFPISVGDEVIGVVAIAAARESAIAHAESITAAAGAAFARLIRDASR